MIIGTLTTGAAVDTVINLTYLPEYIAFEAATQLSGIKIEVLGEGVIVDLDADGISTIGRAGAQSFKTNGYLIPLADGLIKGKNVVMTFTNSAAQTPSIRAWSDSLGSRYVKSTQQKVFANSGVEIAGDSFGFISFENGSDANDELTIKWNGVSQKVNLTDLQYRNSLMFEISNTDEDFYLIQDGSIDMLSYIPNADTTLYLQKYIPAA